MPLCGRKPYEAPPLTEDQKKILYEIELIADTMDTTWIHFCGRDFGADGIIGLIPGVGDFATGLISGWVMMRIWFAFDKRIRRKTVPMLFNIWVDMLIGCIPLFGDIFDVGWKSNIKNINIVRKHYGMDPMPEKKPEQGEQEEEEGTEYKRFGRRSKQDRSMPVDFEEEKKDEES